MSHTAGPDLAIVLVGTLVLLAGCASGSAVAPSSSTDSTATNALVIPSPSSAMSPSVGPGEPWIAYQGGTGGPARIRLVRPDGTGDHPLTPTDLPGEQFHPDWSHDGTRIAFSVADDDGTRDIWVVGADGANARRVVDCSAPCAWTDDPAWSPDDGVLVFARVTATNGGPDGEPTVETIDIATGTTAILYTGQPIEAIFVPRWAPDGHRLVLEIDRFASARIDEEVVDEATVGIIDSEDATPVFDPLVPWSTKAASPDWSPMDDQIVFAMPADPGAEPADLHLIDADGADDHVLTDFAAGGGWAIQPSWTPDGARITFTGEDIVNTQANVAMIGADGTGLTRMRFDGTGRTHPRLRPTP